MLTLSREHTDDVHVIASQMIADTSHAAANSSSTKSTCDASTASRTSRSASSPSAEKTRRMTLSQKICIFRTSFVRT